MPDRLFTRPRIEENQWEVSGFARKPYAVLIADDHPIVREGLATLINSRSDMPVVAEASNGQEAVEKYVA